MKKLESLKGSKFELNTEELNLHGGRAAGPDYSMKYYTTYDTDCNECYDEEVYDICWYME
ncbi:hypothetical protein [Psychroserpens algicola]|uniref:Natural product n=1 Tax=Psychroserpens algicola TaxID=1719034 RepID=A0ABT0HC28_9FLAO|nr:hypothetical protein [Psychroserpens algicola]MCK8481926.1 hypothetical protein [Psychroserpens algicola]